jgi:homoserine dehydrogenase
LSPAWSRIALLGFGHVGAATARRLASPGAFPSLELTHIFDRRASLKQARHPALASVRWTETVDDILRSDADIVVDLVADLAVQTSNVLIHRSSFSCQEVV